MLAHGPWLAVIDGRNIANIDENIVGLKPDSVIVQAGMPLNTKSEAFRNAKTVDILRVALPASAKIDIKNAFVGKVTGSASVAMMLGGDTDDSRLMWVSVGGERAYVLKRLDTEAPKFPVVGELHADQGKIHIKVIAHFPSDCASRCERPLHHKTPTGHEPLANS